MHLEFHHRQRQRRGRQRRGAPQRGGTVSMLGQSDIFNLDPVSAYYTVSSMIELLFTRQLYQYRDVANFDLPLRAAARLHVLRVRAGLRPGQRLGVGVVMTTG